MICPYLGGTGPLNVCNASVTLMSPGAADKERYCTTEEHYRCAMLLAHYLRIGNKGGKAA